MGFRSRPRNGWQKKLQERMLDIGEKGAKSEGMSEDRPTMYMQKVNTRETKCLYGRHAYFGNYPCKL